MRYQPQGLARIDWSNPITRGLAFAHALNGRNVQGHGAPGVLSGTAVATASPKGLGLQTASTTSTLYTASDTGITGSNYSLLAVGSATSTSAIQSAIDDDNGTTRCFQFRINSAKANLIAFDTGGATYSVSAGTMTAAQLSQGFVIGAQVAGNSLAVFQNGIKTSGTAVNTQRTPTGDFAIGQRKAGSATTGWATGGLSLVAGWTRTLSDAEMRSLAENPWQLFAASEEYDEVAAAGGTRHTLAGADCSQSNTSSAGAIVQHHQLTGAATTQANASSVAAAGVRHVLAGSTASQANASSTGAIGQRHALAGAGTAQGNTSSSAAIVQRHQLAGASCEQANTSSTAALGQQPHILAGSTSSQANGGTSGAIVQRHILAGAACAQLSASGGGAIRQRHQLQGANCIQVNLSPGGALEWPVPPAEVFMPSAPRTFRFAAENRRFVFAPEDRTIKFNA